jgi:hypothetical protein
MKIKRLLKPIVTSAVMLFLFAVTELSANTIGTFSSSRANTNAVLNIIDGSSMDTATAALVNDGHTFQVMDAGIDAGTLATVDVLYLNLGNTASISVLSSAEAGAIATWVDAGGTLIVQSDVALWGVSYGNLTSLFGVQYLNEFLSIGTVSVTNPYPRITNGTYGTVSTVATGATGSIDPGASSGLSIIDNSAGSFLYVLAPDTGFAGAGTAIFLTDINSFDGPSNSNGLIEEDDETLWRNMFSLAGSAPPPVTGPATPVPTMSVWGLGMLISLMGLIGFNRRRKM